jgi:hypothetical protein
VPPAKSSPDRPNPGWLLGRPVPKGNVTFRPGTQGRPVATIERSTFTAFPDWHRT